MILAGTDTTKHTLVWGIHYLSENPQWQARLREEQLNNVTRGDDSYIICLADLQKLPLMEATVLEIFRYFLSYFQNIFKHEFCVHTS